MNAKRIEIFDYLKGFAITTIVLMHLLEEYILPKPISLAVQFGGAGVHAFFLCSGFGLFLSYLMKPLDYVSFLKKRLRRVYIPYFVAISIIALWNVLFLRDGGGIFIKWLSHVLLFRMFFESLNSSLCPTFWFISSIFQFYLFWPLIVRLYKMKHGIVCAFVISIAWMFMVDKLGYNDIRVWNSFFLQYLWEFVVGMRIADLVRSNQKISLNWKLLLSSTSIGLLGMIASTVLFPQFKPYNDFFSLLGYCGISFCLWKLGCEWFNKLFKRISKIAYEWYLVHYSVFLILWWVLGGKVAFPLEIITLFVISLFCGKIYQIVLKRLI